MGHFHSSNLDRLLLKRMYAKGKVSQKEVVDLALQKKEYVHASEGIYEEKYLLQSGIGALFFIHYDRHDIEPVVTDKESLDLIQRWCSEDDDSLEDCFDENGESTGDLAKLEAIPFRFAPGRRKQYLDLTIVEVDT